jgi:hypothetical protein
LERRVKARDIFLRLGCGFYTVLLYAYPPEFRSRYKKEMTLAFKDDLHQTLHDGSLWNQLLFPFQMAKDFLTSVLRERIKSLDAVGMSFLVAASGIGLYASYVDRHNATEVYPTLSIALIGSFLLGLIRPTRSWRWAIIIALCIPFAGSLSNMRDRLSSSGAWAIFAVVLIPSLIGAVAGSFMRRGIGLRTEVTREA